MKYILKSGAYIKPYLSKYYWIDADIVREKVIEAENVNDALETYVERVNNEYSLRISKNAIKEKSPIYKDDENGEAKQIGYVLTALTDIFTDTGDFKSVYVDLWVEIITVIDTEF